MVIYRYTDQVSYRDTVLHKYQNIKMSYSTEWCMSYVVNITFLCVKVGGKHSILVRKVTDYLY